jgi:hypothetical protein
MFDLASTSTLRIAIAANITRRTARRMTEPMPRFTSPRSIVDKITFSDRIDLRIRNRRTMLSKRPHRKISKLGILETKSIHPHRRNANFLGATASRQKKSARNTKQMDVSNQCKSWSVSRLSGQTVSANVAHKTYTDRATSTNCGVEISWPFFWEGTLRVNHDPLSIAMVAACQTRGFPGLKI